MKTVKIAVLLFLVLVLGAPGHLASGAGGHGAGLKKRVIADRERNIVLPHTDGHWQRTKDYVEEEPDPDYVHASVKAHEAFRDIKFAVRVHWGIYSLWQMDGESWGFLDLPDEKKAEYNQLYRTFNPQRFDADEWMSLFSRAGIKAVAFTTKHHEGFSMFDTGTKVVRRVNYLDPEHPIEECCLDYDIMETPYGKDILKEICDAAHRYRMKIDLYFSHPDWYDADFRPYNYHPLTTPDMERNIGNYGYGYKNDRPVIMSPDRTPEETQRMVARHREQLRELLTNYGRIDMLCLDQWLGKDVWPQTKETVKMIRKLQPDIMIRARGIGNYGDYYTPEGFVPGDKENTDMPWMVIYPLGKSFSYDKDGANYKGAGWMVHNIIDCAAKGGSFMVGIGPDGNGEFHPEAVRQLEQVGDWMRVNGTGIYSTRAREIWKSGDVYFTVSKNGKNVFAFVETWPGRELLIPSVEPEKGSRIFMLGYDEPLDWTKAGDGIKVSIPEVLGDEGRRPCSYAWGFKIKVR